MKNEYIKKPEWLRIKFQSNHNYSIVHSTVKDNGLHTICQSGRCPNISECWNRGTATFMILGEICTRACRFCNVITGKPLAINQEEPMKVAESIHLMKLKHAVITSVDRDDLPDKGAGQWAETIRVVKEVNQGLTLEVLIPDFDGDTSLADLVIAAKPDIISHNLETVRRLTPKIRSRAKYDTSLKILKHIADNNVISKTGIMLGLGETEEEILELMDDALNAGCSVLTIGQYMQPSRQNIPVSAYIHPDKFAEYKQIGLQKGFRIVESAPFVRSSYCAENHLL
ncbi:MAG: lipoyl synthase [Paludibacteraceae bacterium]